MQKPSRLVKSAFVVSLVAALAACGGGGDTLEGGQPPSSGGGSEGGAPTPPPPGEPYSGPTTATVSGSALGSAVLIDGAGVQVSDLVGDASGLTKQIRLGDGIRAFFNPSDLEESTVGPAKVMTLTSGVLVSTVALPTGAGAGKLAPKAESRTPFGEIAGNYKTLTVSKMPATAPVGSIQLWDCRVNGGSKTEPFNGGDIGTDYAVSGTARLGLDPAGDGFWEPSLAVKWTPFVQRTLNQIRPLKGTVIEDLEIDGIKQALALGARSRTDMTVSLAWRMKQDPSAQDSPAFYGTTTFACSLSNGAPDETPPGFVPPAPPSPLNPPPPPAKTPDPEADPSPEPSPEISGGALSLRAGVSGFASGMGMVATNAGGAAHRMFVEGGPLSEPIELNQNLLVRKYETINQKGWDQEAVISGTHKVLFSAADASGARSPQGAYRLTIKAGGMLVNGALREFYREGPPLVIDHDLRPATPLAFQTNGTLLQDFPGEFNEGAFEQLGTDFGLTFPDDNGVQTPNLVSVSLQGGLMLAYPRVGFLYWDQHLPSPPAESFTQYTPERGPGLLYAHAVTRAPQQATTYSCGAAQGFAYRAGDASAAMGSSLVSVPTVGGSAQLRIDAPEQKGETSTLSDTFKVKLRYVDLVVNGNRITQTFDSAKVGRDMQSGNYLLDGWAGSKLEPLGYMVLPGEEYIATDGLFTRNIAVLWRGQAQGKPYADTALFSMTCTRERATEREREALFTQAPAR